jgi:SAM-dependent methyltransferase
MELIDIIRRQMPPQPWAEGEKIPWNDPEFSRRMLREHLSQAHDAASRRFEFIDRHVQWIHQALLSSQPGRILDLGCGPGFYLERLARLGHSMVGIDFSPASIAYARQSVQDLPVEILEADIRQADFGDGYDLVMFIYGELNVFRPAQARDIISKAYAALKPGGRLLLEVSTYTSVRRIGQAPASWDASEQGLFSDQPHLVLTESFWDAGASVATERFFILDAATGNLSRMAASTQAYSREQYKNLLEGVGFQQIAFFANLFGEMGEPGEVFPITAVKSSV